MGESKETYDESAVAELEQLLAEEVSVKEQEDAMQRSEELRERRRRRENQRKIQKIRILIIALIVLVLGGAFAGTMIYRNSLAYKLCRVEAGGTVLPSDFLKKADPKAYFTEDSDKIDTMVPGEYKVKIKTGLFTVSSVLYVQDTIAPVLETKDIQLAYGETCTIEDFVTKLEDVTKTTLAFKQEPDFSLSGEQVLTITATDLGGNVASRDVKLWLTPVYSPVHVELGDFLPAITEVIVDGVEAEYVSDLSLIDTGKEGEYSVVVRVEGTDYTVKMIVKDTVAPALEVQEVMDYSVIKKVPADFVVSSEDLSGVTISFKQEPDFNFVGTQEVVIVAVDGAGNVTEKATQLIQVADEDDPVFLECEDFIVYLGDTVAYKSKVSVTDNCEIGLNLTVDAAAVDLKTEGVYPVTYTVTDAAGNSVSKTINVTVKEYRADEIALYEKVDAILADLITEDMTPREKCKKIYNYIRSVVGYVSTSDKGDWISAAAEGLKKGRGDCYVYFAVSKVMLTRAGIPNLDIERIRVGDSMHFWNLVDLGDGHGWYHFDATPRKDKTVIFLWDDAKLMEYSKKNNGSHNYDPALYPEIN